MDIILASSSPYRRALLTRILPDIQCHPPAIDEAPLPGEHPKTLALRLASEKTKAVARQTGPALIIGSDQVAWHQDRQLTKPGNRRRNIEQLMRCQGEEVHFYTSLALYNSAEDRMHSCVETYRTKFRPLSREQIEQYVDREQAYDCAGGFKIESLGIALFESLSGDDPNTLIGLPMIRLIDMLHQEGIPII